MPPRRDIKGALRDPAVLKARLEFRASRLAHRVGYHLVPISGDDRDYLDRDADHAMPLPHGAGAILDSNNPRLTALRERYSGLDLPVTVHSRWAEDVVDWLVDLRRFRGDTLFVWHFRELPRVTALKYFAYAEYVRSLDHAGLLERLGEDGAFGCWTFDFAGRGRYSRDLLDSVNQIYFLDRSLGVLDCPALRILDVGAGYGRLAHRTAQAVAGLKDYCCVDAVPEGTFLSEYYLEHRGVTPPARVVPLDRIDSELHCAGFDLAVNIHSFSECPIAAIEWWVTKLARLRVPRLLIVPNDGQQLLSLEPDQSRRDFGPVLANAGYRLAEVEPVIRDPAVENLTGFDYRFMLFELAA